MNAKRLAALAVAVFAWAAVHAVAQVGIGSAPGSGGVTWGVGVGAGTHCNQVIDSIRKNWMDVKSIMAPDSKAMRPRSKEFYCVAPAYTQHALPRPAAMLTGLQCFDIEGLGFCCDSQLQQCAAMLP